MIVVSPASLRFAKQALRPRLVRITSRVTTLPDRVEGIEFPFEYTGPFVLTLTNSQVRTIAKMIFSVLSRFCGEPILLFARNTPQRSDETLRKKRDNWNP